MTLEKTLSTLEKQFAFLAADAAKKEFRGETSYLLPKDKIKEVCAYCKDRLDFEMLLDICSVDNFGEDPRFEVVYELYSMANGHHLRLKVQVDEDDLTVDTVTGVWRTADWHEREIYDMMGIKFNDHPDLRRILMWEGYPYYPLRKDFPLEGKPSDAPDVAFTAPAPLQGGPFVAPAEDRTRSKSEPRAKRAMWETGG